MELLPGGGGRRRERRKPGPGRSRGEGGVGDGPYGPYPGSKGLGVWLFGLVRFKPHAMMNAGPSAMWSEGGGRGLPRGVAWPPCSDVLPRVPRAGVGLDGGAAAGEVRPDRPRTPQRCLAAAGPPPDLQPFRVLMMC